LTRTWFVPLSLVYTWFVTLSVCDHSQGVYFPPTWRWSMVFWGLFLKKKKKSGFRIPYHSMIPGTLACDPIPKILEIEMPRSAKWAWDLPYSGCNITLLECLIFNQCTCTRVSCAPILTRSLNPPLWHSKSGVNHRPNDPMPILLSVNRNPYWAFQFQDAG